MIGYFSWSRVFVWRMAFCPVFPGVSPVAVFLWGLLVASRFAYQYHLTVVVGCWRFLLVACICLAYGVLSSVPLVSHLLLFFVGLVGLLLVLRINII